MRESIDNAVPSPRSDPAAIHGAEQAFRQTYPTFDSASSLDELRAKEYARLDELDHVYLDYTGGGLYAESQLREHFELLRGGVFGNPHSLGLVTNFADVYRLVDFAHTFLDTFPVESDLAPRLHC